MVLLFDLELNLIDYGTVEQLCSLYDLDRRNAHRAIKNDTLTICRCASYTLRYTPIDNIINYYCYQTKSERKAVLVACGAKPHKIGQYFLAELDAEIRQPLEAEFPFVDDTSANKYILYSNCANASLPAEATAKADTATEEQYRQYVVSYKGKYRHMDESKASAEGYYNYLKNPRISADKARASFKASYEVTHDKPLPWFPARYGVYAD